MLSLKEQKRKEKEKKTGARKRKRKRKTIEGVEGGNRNTPSSMNREVVEKGIEEEKGNEYISFSTSCSQNPSSEKLYTTPRPTFAVTQTLFHSRVVGRIATIRMKTRRGGIALGWDGLGWDHGRWRSRG